MIDSRYKEYFKAIGVYHRTSPGQRPQTLAGFIFTSARHHPDGFTRQLLQRFHQNEVNKNAQQRERPA